MSQPSSLPSLLRTISLIGVGAWLAWQLINISMGLTGFMPVLRALVVVGIILISIGLGFRYLRRTRGGGWQRTDGPLLIFAAVLLLFEINLESPNRHAAGVGVNILPWSVDVASARDAQLAGVLEEAWRQHLWQQNQWQPVVFFAPPAGQLPPAPTVQTSITVTNQQLSFQTGIYTADTGPAGLNGNPGDGLLVNASGTARASGADLLEQAINALGSRFTQRRDDATALAVQPMRISQAEIDCALNDRGVQNLALQGLRQSVFREPDSALQHAALADCALRIFQSAPQTGVALRHEARASANRAIRLQPGLPIAQWTTAAVAWRFDADPVKARQLWRQVLDTFPGQAGIRLDLAGMYFSAGLTPDAMHEVDRARTTAPDHPRAAYLQALAALEPRSGGQNYQQAVELLEAAVTLTPDSDEFRLALALAYQRLGAAEQVLAPFPVTQQLDQNPDSLAYRSWWLASIGDSPGAQALRDQLFAQGDQGPGRAFRLALVALGRGQAEAANLALTDARKNADPRLLWPVTRLLFSAEPVMSQLSADWHAALQSQGEETDSP